MRNNAATEVYNIGETNSYDRHSSVTPHDRRLDWRSTEDQHDKKRNPSPDIYFIRVITLYNDEHIVDKIMRLDIFKG